MVVLRPPEFACVLQKGTTSKESFDATKYRDFLKKGTTLSFACIYMPLWLKWLQLPFFYSIGRCGTRDNVDRAPKMWRWCLVASCIPKPACKAAFQRLCSCPFGWGDCSFRSFLLLAGAVWGTVWTEFSRCWGWGWRGSCVLKRACIIGLLCSCPCGWGACSFRSSPFLTGAVPGTVWTGLLSLHYLTLAALAEVLSASFLDFLLAVRRNSDTVLKMSRRCLVASCVLKPA